MRHFHDKTSEYRDSDLVLNYLGYWTDGGAFYFYNTEPNMDYEQTILAVKKNADDLKIPYKCFEVISHKKLRFFLSTFSRFSFLQLDSWWYYKDKTDTQKVTRWEPMPSVFPDGMR